jgi:hypothetical protein
VNTAVDDLLKQIDHAQQAEELPMQERHSMLQVSLSFQNIHLK